MCQRPLLAGSITLGFDEGTMKNLLSRLANVLVPQVGPRGHESLHHLDAGGILQHLHVDAS
jgi:hypothetical protein